MTIHHIDKKRFLVALSASVGSLIFTCFVCLSSIWVCFALWIQQPLGGFGTCILIALWLTFALSCVGIYITQHIFSRHIDTALYLLAFVLALLWYFHIPPRQDRDWNPEVAKILTYERQGDLITLHHVRNFEWQENGKYIERWETRQFDLNKMNGIDIITSYWMGPQIAHTLVSFNFTDQRPITFSIEIRKEKNESFSAIGGFFRQFELSLVAAEEKDILYTRSNIRKEQVYLFPIQMSNQQSKALFNEYLDTIDELQKEPRWYNTLTSNCTTIVFDMVQAINPQKLPKDIRLLASGYLPNYLYDLNVLSHRYTLKQWYQMAYINTRAAQFNQFKYKTNDNFSAVIRQGLPLNTQSLSSHP